MHELDLGGDDRVDILMLKCHILSASSVVCFASSVFAVCSGELMIHLLQICACIDGQNEMIDTCQNNHPPFSKQNKGGVLWSQTCFLLSRASYTQSVPHETKTN